MTAELPILAFIFVRKFRPDDHRLEFAVIDVGGNDGAAARDFAPDEFRRDEQRHRSAEAFAVVVGGLRALQHCLAAEIFALGDVDHFLGDHAGAGPFELGDRLAGEPLQRLWRIREIPREVLAGGVAVVHRLDRTALIFLHTTALLHPFAAGARQALLQIKHHVGIGVGAGRIVDRERRLAGGGIERDLAQRHFQVRRPLGRRVNLARAGDRSGCDLRR